MPNPYITGLNNAFRAGHEARLSVDGPNDPMPPNPYRRWDMRRSWVDGWNAANSYLMDPEEEAVES